jgi:hypothetical protein
MLPNSNGDGVIVIGKGLIGIPPPGRSETQLQAATDQVAGRAA